MTSIAPVSRTELSQRRQKLRRQRRVRFFQASWRSLAVLGLAAGAVWVATLPAWVIRKPEQVTIKGNQLISAQTIRTLLPIDYPQSLLKIQPQEVSSALKSRAPIAEATIDRQLFPPSLTVRIQERTPVALTLPPVGTVKPDPVSDSDQPEVSPGLLDESGIWISLKSYTSLDQNLKLPTLKITGKVNQYRPYWPQLYQAIHRSAVKISEVNLDDPSNLILKTELGSVHFGLYGANFTNQLKALDQLRRLPTRVNPSQIAHIDLKDPQSPSVQMINPKSPVKLSTP
ncbi:MAG: FtsQ-type POTRA domain-containing protein [Leptolyngbyaceae cyanobacterium SU_3_3]|nr:FtsQ-type POTRA domain-containing protein [Leptolyngbyaceae cyanobacterium SU_3_3]NJR50779.1 FtsQ-type POTRA domain-containing protein [Leptolyngbyaceae cyanobacterium CSU_1_3]